MRKTVFILLSIFLSFSLFLGFIFSTEKGLFFLKKTVNNFCQPFLSIAGVQGKLSSVWTLQGLEIDVNDVKVRVADVKCNWNPGKLLSGEFDLIEVAVRGTTIEIKKGEAVTSTSVIILPKISLPFLIAIKEISIEDLSILAEDGEAIIQVEKAGFQVSWQDYQVVINEFFLKSGDLDLQMHGSLDTRNEWLLDFLGDYSFSGAGVNKLAGTYSFKGPLNSPQVNLGVHQPAAIRLTGTVKNLLDDPLLEATVTGKDVELISFSTVMPEILLAKAEINFSCNMEGYRGSVQAEGDWDDLENIHLTSSLSGNWLGIDFQSLHIVKGDGRATAEKSSISWADIFSWNGHFIFENFNPAIITEELAGKIDAILDSQGKVVENGVEASFEIAKLECVLQEQHISAQGNVFLKEYEVYSDDLLVKSGDFSGNAFIHHGSLSWAESLSWAGDISFDNFDPSPFYSELSGLISGRVKGEFRQLEQGAEGYLTVRELSGKLLGQPISGHGNIELGNNELQTEGLTLKHGTSELQVNGMAGDLLALNFTISTPDISQLIPGGSGTIDVNGKLTGTIQNPELSFDLHGQVLEYREHSVDAIAGKFRGGVISGEMFAGSLQAEGIKSSGIDINNATASITGSVGEHEMALKMSSGYGESELLARGGYQGGSWQGELYGISHHSGGWGNLNQYDSALFVAGTDGFSLANFCLEDGEGHFCLDGAVNTAEEDFSWRINSSLTGVALTWLNRLHLFSVPVKGIINGELEAEGDKEKVSSAKVQFMLPETDLEIVHAGEELQHVILNDTALAGTLQNGVFFGTLSTSVGNGSLLQLSTEINNIGRFSLNPDELVLKGDVNFRNFDLAFMEPLTGYWLEPTGKMDGGLAFSGSLTQPRANGELRIVDGGISLPYQGVTLEKVKLTVSAEKNGADISIEAISGPGHLTLSGKVRYGGDNFHGELLIQGEEFLLFSLPEYEIRVTPDARFIFSEEKGEFSGEVEIPYATITPEELTSSVTVSKDVIYVNDGEELKNEQWPVYTNLHVLLGDEVSIDGYGLKGRLEGGLEIQDVPDSFLTGTGELGLMDGVFTIFGRSLEMERGRVFFSGGPIDNPGIDIRAQKRVSAEEAIGDGYVVGVDVNGLVQDLQFHLFSDPFMEDADILSHLLIGRSLSDSTAKESSVLQAAAVALGVKGGSEIAERFGKIISLDDLHLEGSNEEDVSLVVGKRITKDLYLGYDMNMFSQLGVFRVRYGLGYGFSVETQTSTESTGTDILYTFEK